MQTDQHIPLYLNMYTQIWICFSQTCSLFLILKWNLLMANLQQTMRHFFSTATEKRLNINVCCIPFFISGFLHIYFDNAGYYFYAAITNPSTTCLHTAHRTWIPCSLLNFKCTILTKRLVYRQVCLNYKHRCASHLHFFKYMTSSSVQYTIDTTNSNFWTLENLRCNISKFVFINPFHTHCTVRSTYLL